MILNPDNMLSLRGKPIYDDYTNFYNVGKKTGKTHLYFWIKVYSPGRSYRVGKPTFDYICMHVYGHVKDTEHPKGGMAEQLLKRISKNVFITCYCHVSQSKRISKNGKVSSNLECYLDGFRTEDQTLVVRSYDSKKREKEELDKIEFKY